MAKGSKAKKDKRKSHRDCLKALCFFCLQKKKEVRLLKDNEIDFVCAGPYPDYRTNSDFLPSAICSTCRKKIANFMSETKESPTKFESAAPVEKYDSIVSELKLLQYESLDCFCSVCKIIRAGPINLPKASPSDSVEPTSSATEISAQNESNSTSDDSTGPTTSPSKAPPSDSLEPLCSGSENSAQNESNTTSDDSSGPTTSSSQSSSKNESLVLMCIKCWQKVGKGIPHACNELSKQKNLTAQLSPSTRQKQAAITIGEAARSSSDKNILLKTGGRPLLVSKQAVQEVRTGHDFFFGMQTDNPALSDKKLKNMAFRYRTFHGGNSVESHFVPALVEAKNECKPYFDWKHFIFEEKDKATGVTKDVSKPVVFCNDVREFIKFVKEKRDIVDKDYIAKFGLDGGGGSIKVTLSLIKRPSDEPQPPPTKKSKKSDSTDLSQPNIQTVSPPTPIPIDNVDNLDKDPDWSAPRIRINRSSADPSENSSASTSNSENPGIRKPINSKRVRPRYLESGVKQLFVIASAPGAKETYENIKKIIDILKVFEISNEGIDFLNLGDEDSLHTDLKDWNELFGLMQHSSKHPCTWCEGRAGNWQKNCTRRTLGRIRMLAKKYQNDMKRWESAKARGIKSVKKPDTADYFCCVREPLIGGNDDKSIYDVCPLPELHIMNGVLNHIFVKLNEKWGEDRAFKWAAEKHFILEDAHQGRGFKGPNSRKILHVAHELALDRELPRDLKIFADALVKFDAVVAGSFGMIESKTIQTDILAFEKAFMKLGISVTPKVHAVIEHLPEFLALGYGPLGPYSEQATEAAHYDFEKIWKNYPSNPLKPDQVGEMHFKAILKYTWLHLKPI